MALKYYVVELEARGMWSGTILAESLEAAKEIMEQEIRPHDLNLDDYVVTYTNVEAKF